MKKITPYIGITDFMNFQQVQQMLEIFNFYISKDSKIKLHVGVMMSRKTLLGLETKWSKAFPPKESIAEIFSSDKVYNCLHYADYDNDPDFAEHLAFALSYGGKNLNAIQLDMVWPDPRMLKKALEIYGRDIEVVLQVGKDAIEDADNNPIEVTRRLESYEGIIHRVLLDKSMGRGLGMDAQALIPFASEIKNRFSDLGIVVAGGLGPYSMHLAEPFIEKFPDASIDAQGKLRVSGNALDPIDWGMAGEYLVRAIEIMD